jgi:predicted transcriptional regulator
VSQQIELVQEKVESARESAEEVALEAIVGAYPRSELQASILDVLSKNKRPMTPKDIAHSVNRSIEATNRALGKMARRGITETVKGDDGGEQIQTRTHSRNREPSN